MAELETVTVTLRVPEQDFEATYSKAEWDEAVRTNSVGDLTDWWRSDISSEIEEELYGPDGKRVSLW